MSKSVSLPGTRNASAARPARGRLTTHVLDTVKGGPAVGMSIELLVREGWAEGCTEGHWRSRCRVVTNGDGRVDEPLLSGEALDVGCYRLVFDVSAYFLTQGVVLSEPAFLGKVPVDFGIADPMAHYHVPLLVSPWSYSTYRGS